MAAIRAARRASVSSCITSRSGPSACSSTSSRAPWMTTSPHVAKGGDDPANPAWHIGGGRIPNDAGSPIPFTMLLNLASVVNADRPDMLWGFIRRYHPGAGPEETPFLARLVDYAVAYYRDFVRPAKRFRPATRGRRQPRLNDLADTLAVMPADSTAEAIQDEVYAVGKRHPFPALKNWFECLYQVLLGQQEGPRFGGFVALYGVTETVGLIRSALGTPGRSSLKRYLRHHPRAARRHAAGGRDLCRPEGIPPPQARRTSRPRYRRFPASALIIAFVVDRAVLRGADILRPARHHLCWAQGDAIAGSPSRRSAPTPCRIISVSPPCPALPSATGCTPIGG